MTITQVLPVVQSKQLFGLLALRDAVLLTLSSSPVTVTNNAPTWRNSNKQGAFLVQTLTQERNSLFSLRFASV